MFSRQHQLLAFADDICIVARNARALTDAFNELRDSIYKNWPTGKHK
jgi:hypothetical protein